MSATGTLIKRELVLKTGQKFKLRSVKEYSVSGTDFTDKTLHKFFLEGDNELFIQGDNIAYVKTWQ